MQTGTISVCSTNRDELGYGSAYNFDIDVEVVGERSLAVSTHQIQLHLSGVRQRGTQAV